jgi:hypothetical protein
MRNKPRRQQPVAIQGTLKPAAWDERQGSSRLWFVTDDRRYEVFDDDIGQALNGHLYETIRARGVLDQRGGRSVFCIRSFESVDHDEPAEPAAMVGGTSE